jgi:UPF0755 protein
VQGLGRVFRRVALFEVEGTTARIASVAGMGSPRLGTSVSLVEETPLRWAVAAASPIVGAGAAPGGAAIAAVMGLSTPRAYAVIPLVTNGRLRALAYVDQANDSLPLSAASQLFAFCDRILLGSNDSAKPPRHGHRSTARWRHRLRPPTFLRLVEDEPPAIDPMVEAAAQRALWDDLPEELDPDLARNFSEPELAEYRFADEETDSESESDSENHDLCQATPTVEPDVLTADAVVAPQRQPRLPARHRAWVAVAALGVLSTAAGIALPLAPVDGSKGHRLVQIPRDATVPEIARHLAEAGVIRSATAFRLLARFTGTDRSLRAGAYRLPTGAWAPAVLAELHRGQVHTRTVTVPEGLTLTETAKLLESEGLARATDILREAYSPDLLARYAIPASNVEGYLFPETYTLAQGLSAREILTVMLDESRDHLADLAANRNLDARELHKHVILASIVEREARDSSEYDRVAGVFNNRLERNMRLESCATVQYILGEPKARLTYADVRRESPYNTYLHGGLPPGPISNPGRAALDAALLPERHDFLFFFARDDGSHTHVFSRTFAAHQERQRRMRSGSR